jgi:ubiquinone/menaquinone biosynthesis C-methylase UbiE
MKPNNNRQIVPKRTAAHCLFAHGCDRICTLYIEQLFINELLFQMEKEASMTTMVGMSKSQRRYLPAAGRDLFLPLYDLIARLLGADGARQKLFDLLALRPGDRVLDIGCGTGTFATTLKQRYPGVEVTGLDPDPKALARARSKAEQAKVSIGFDQGFADSLEYPAASFDLVFSSFMFHHLEGSTRERTLREVRRVLKPGGSLYLLDFEVSPAGHGLFNLFHSGQRMRDNTESRILSLMGDAGLSECKKIAIRPVLLGFGRAGYYQAAVLR